MKVLVFEVTFLPSLIIWLVTLENVLRPLFFIIWYMEAIQKDEGNKTYLLYAVQSKSEDLRGNIICGFFVVLQIKKKKKKILGNEF